MEIKFTRFFFLIGIVVLTGCASQRVSTSAFLAPADFAAVDKNANFAVVSNSNIPNPIFDITVKQKAEKILKSKNYHITDSTSAQYFVRYAYHLEGSSGPSRAFFSFPGFSNFYVSTGSYDPYVGGGLGFATLMPSAYSGYTAKLRIRVTRPKAQGAPGEEDVLWVAETVADSDNPDLRKVIDYLLAAAFKYFLEDTGEGKILKLSKKDIDIKMLADDSQDAAAV